ncbi:MAG: SDR family oxidoreductase [Burkholderiaceae bacterium]
MQILLTGAHGFVGRNLRTALRHAGHRVICVGHRGSSGGRAGDEADFATDEVDDWLPRLAGIDVVINAVGIFRERGAQSFEAIHVRGPAMLFEACRRAGIPRVIQLSALGADDEAFSAYHLSKHRADQQLLALGLPSVAIVQPSLLYGRGGASARLFTALASLPFILLPGDGRQRIQPLHIDDAVHGILALLPAQGAQGVIAFVGPRPITLREFLLTLRDALRLPRSFVLPVPISLVRVIASLLASRPGSLLSPAGLLSPDSLQMLERGNTGDPAALTRLIGTAPRPPACFIDEDERPAQRAAALLCWWRPLLRGVVALVWIVTGWVSLTVYPVADSLALLQRSGVPAAWTMPALVGAALLDIALGLAALLPGRRWPWAAQMLLTLFYTVIISLRLPEYWAHPYGPLLKNLPLLMATWLLWQTETPRPPARRRP